MITTNSPAIFYLRLVGRTVVHEHPQKKRGNRTYSGKENDVSKKITAKKLLCVEIFRNMTGKLFLVVSLNVIFLASKRV